MARFIETAPGVRINEQYASSAIIEAANKGVYKFVNEADPATPPPKKTGIELPDKPELPNLSGGETREITLDSLISASRPAINEADIRAQNEAALSAKKSIIGSKYGGKIAAAREESAEQLDTLEGELGAKRRFSTSAQAFLKFVESENNKKIAELEVQMDEALNNADIEFANLVNQRIDKVRAEAQQDFQNTLSILQFAETQRTNKLNRARLEAEDEKGKNKIYVSDVLASGVTDVNSIYRILKEQGKNVPLTDIAETMKSIQDVEFSMQGITGEWLAARENDPQMAGLSLEDYVFMKNPEKGLELKKKRLEVEKMEKDLLNSGIEGDPYELQAYAQQYAVTGIKPTGIPKDSFGLIAQAAKEIPRPKGAIVNALTGVVDSKTPSTEQQDYSRLYNIVNNVQRLKDLDTKRWGGLIGGTLGKVFGDDESNAYNVVLKAIVDDMSRMQSGAALTAEEISFYEDYLPTRLSDTSGKSNLFFEDSAKRIQFFEDFVNNRLSERLANNGLVIYGYSKVDIGDKQYTVGDIITNERGQTGRVLPDGSVSIDEEDIDETSININDLDEISVEIPEASRLSFVNNNPGNLRYANQSGASKGEGGFAKFKTPEDGFKALINQIKVDARRGLTLASFITKYAPPTENDTQGYIDFIASATSTSPNVPIARMDLGKLARLIARKESSSNIS